MDLPSSFMRLTRIRSSEKGIRNCAAQIFFNRVAQWTSGEAWMKSALHQK
jgi:hypothetical protein